jgi:hypothetical protein
MCIRITRELKAVYEQSVRIGLNEKIGFPVFVKMLTLLGYVNSTLCDSNSSILLPTMSAKEEQLVSLAWKTIRSKGNDTTEISGINDYLDFKG